MKIAYLVPTPLAFQSSVGIKVRRTLSTWAELGVTHRLFTMSAAADDWGPQDIEAEVALLAPDAHPELERQRAARVLADAMASYAPDVVYTRPTPYVLALERVFRSRVTIQEINTDDRIEFTKRASRLRFLHSPTRHLTLRHADGFIFVTDELRRSRSFARYGGRPAVTIANGIPLDEVEQLPAPSNGRIRAIFLSGSAGEWQGFDKLSHLATALPDWDVDIVGTCPDRTFFPQNVRVHGPVHGEALRRHLAEADVAFGALALHRKNMHEACNLKVRECLAHGIPMILGSKDTDFPDGAPFILTIGNDPDNALRSAADIRAFGERMRGVRVPRAAIQHLDLPGKERQRIRFLHRVLDAHG